MVFDFRAAALLLAISAPPRKEERRKKSTVKEKDTVDSFATRTLDRYKENLLFVSSTYVGLTIYNYYLHTHTRVRARIYLYILVYVRMYPSTDLNIIYVQVANTYRCACEISRNSRQLLN